MPAAGYPRGGTRRWQAINGLLFASFVFFCVEMPLMWYGEKGYANSFFFWLDFLGTVSLIFDIPWLVAVVRKHHCCFNPSPLFPRRHL